MLAWEIPYERGVGMDSRWLVIEGDTGFFTFTKRLHALLHGVAADGSTITQAEQAGYAQTLARNAQALIGRVRSADVVILHDPQTAGLIPHLVRHGCRVVWRCHIGVDQPNQVARDAWQFLLPAVGAAHATVFSRRAYIWEGLDRRKVKIIYPAIDAFTPKNQEMDGKTVAAVLHATGILADGAAGGEPTFRRRDGSPVRVQRATELFPETRIPADAPLVVQVSRWDRLKDPRGVMDGVAEFVAPKVDGHLVLARPPDRRSQRPGGVRRRHRRAPRPPGGRRAARRRREGASAAGVPRAATPYGAGAAGGTPIAKRRVALHPGSVAA